MRPLFFLFLFFTLCAHGQNGVGLVLSGGGATGLSHIGVIKALEEDSIPIDFITGTSAGALVGGMYAAGLSPQEIEALVKDEKFLMMSQGKLESRFQYYFKEEEPNSSMVSLRLSKDSLRQTTLPTNLVTPAMMDFEMMTGLSQASAVAKYDFNQLFVPFRCVASDIASKKSVVFRNGHLNEAVRASMSYPFYFRPIKVNGVLLFDGGLYDNFPSDVMYEDFLPDFIIGSNVSNNVSPPTEENIMSQLKNMIVTRQMYEIRCDNGIIIVPPVRDISTFDFSNAEEAIEIGYAEAKKHIDSIKRSVSRRISPKELEQKRMEFRKQFQPLMFSSITMEGLSKRQQEFVRKTLVRKKEKLIPVSDLQPRYYRVYNDEKISFIYPKATWVNEDSAFHLNLDIRKEKDFNVEFGGNFSSRPINTGFVGLQYHLLRRSSWTFSASSYFGRFYAAAHVSLRYEPPTRTPFYIEPEFTLHRWDYFRSLSTFFEDIKPSYIVQEEEYAGVNFGLPVKTKGKLVVFGRYSQTIDDYYQTENFTSIDTTDRTSVFAWTHGITYERSSLNKKQWANEGSLLQVHGQYVFGREVSIPGSTSIERDTFAGNHQWFLAKIHFQNYYKRRGILRLGIQAEGVYSIQPFYSNYTATILSSPYYSPIPEMKTLFKPDFKAFQYISVGHQVIFNFFKNLDWRIEGYAFQPLSSIQQDENGNPFYSDPLLKRFFVASSSLVFFSPVGPAALSVNYYPSQDRPISVLFNFGYILFNRNGLK